MDYSLFCISQIFWRDSYWYNFSLDGLRKDLSLIRWQCMDIEYHLVSNFFKNEFHDPVLVCFFSFLCSKNDNFFFFHFLQKLDIHHLGELQSPDTPHSNNISLSSYVWIYLLPYLALYVIVLCVFFVCLFVLTLKTISLSKLKSSKCIRQHWKRWVNIDCRLVGYPLVFWRSTIISGRWQNQRVLIMKTRCYFK